MPWIVKKPAGIEKIFEYEDKMNKLVSSSKIAVLGLYNEKETDKEILGDLKKVHKKISKNYILYKNENNDK